MELRRGTPSDLSFVHRSEKRYIEEVEGDRLVAWQGAIERHLDQWVANLPRTTIAQSRGIRVGYLSWEREGDRAVLASVNVDPSHRRRGVASGPMKRFEDDARTAGCSVAELGFVSLTPARHLYEALGYRATEAVGRYVRMTKLLSGVRP